MFRRKELSPKTAIPCENSLKPSLLLILALTLLQASSQENLFLQGDFETFDVGIHQYGSSDW